jgi:hypothetical protein
MQTRPGHSRVFVARLADTKYGDVGLSGAKVLVFAGGGDVLVEVSVFELYHRAASLADHVLVRASSEDRFVMHMRIAVPKFAEQPRLHQQRQRPIDRPTADGSIGLGELAGQFVGLKMMPLLHRTGEHRPSCGSESVTTISEERSELCPRIALDIGLQGRFHMHVLY